MQYQLNTIGYDAILIRFNGADNKQLLPIIYALNQQLKSAADLNNVIIDIIPSYQTLLVTFDILKIDAVQLVNNIDLHISQLLKRRQQTNQQAFTEAQLISSYTQTMAVDLIEIPVCYHKSLAPDLSSLSRHTCLNIDDIIQIHSSTIYSCYAIGFMPNFGYLGDVDKRIQIPRHINPRTQVAAGSVGIADNQTAIYPKASPGGWQIIGQSPTKLNKLGKLEKLTVGCQVKFKPISLEEFNFYQQQVTSL